MNSSTMAEKMKRARKQEQKKSENDLKDTTGSKLDNPRTVEFLLCHISKRHLQIVLSAIVFYILCIAAYYPFHGSTLNTTVWNMSGNKFLKGYSNRNYFDQDTEFLVPSLNERCKETHSKAMLGNITPSWLQNGHYVKLQERNKPLLKQIQRQNMTIESSVSCPQYFTVTIHEPKSAYQLCDTVELRIQARDCRNNTKKTGGDYLWAWLTSDKVSASQNHEGKIEDFDNGTYVARFRLRWKGIIIPKVAFLRTSEEIAFLREWREKVPARFCYIGVFEDRNKNVEVPCHVSPWMRLSGTEFMTNTTRHLCNFTDPLTGIPWFCAKPENSSCHSHKYYKGCTYRESRITHTNQYIRKSKLHYVKHSVQLNVFGNQSFSTCSKQKLSACSVGLNTGSQKENHSLTTGFYYQNKWQSLLCQKKEFNSSVITKLLENKRVYLYGDSTIRQWHDYLYTNLDKTSVRTGNRMSYKSYDRKNNISLSFYFHGFPIRGSIYPVTVFDYVANRLDSVIGGPEVVVVITLWAHFTATSLDFYRQRVNSIKYSIGCLLLRNPATRVFIKSANTRSEEDACTMSNLYAFELDRLMREIMSELPLVTIIDTWDMTMGHKSGFDIHPKEGVIKNEIDLLLSYI